MSKKRQVLTAIFENCQVRGNPVFDNELVKQYCQSIGFGNAYDVTKIDHSRLLPAVMKQGKGHFVIHLGKGKHQIVPNVSYGYHQLEPIEEHEKQIREYRPSLLNELDSSESNILTVCYNQQILNDFLYRETAARPLLYLPRRTFISGHYRIASQRIEVNRLQMEMDAVLEMNGVVTVFEGKNGFPDDFAAYQLFHPYLYFDSLRQDSRIAVKEIQCCYLQRETGQGESILRLHLYRFRNRDLVSIELIRKAEYTLRVRA